MVDDYDPRMRQLPTLQRRGPNTSGLDVPSVVLAIVVTTLALGELLLVADGLPFSWVLAALFLLPALALRRTHPLLAVVIASAGFAVPVSPAELPVATPFLVLLFLLASLGWHLPARPGLIGVGVVLATGLGRQVGTGTFSIGDALVNGVIILGAWGAAFFLRQAQERRIASEVLADRAAREAVEAERARIARDLHDSMGHALTLITLQAGGTAERVTDSDTQALLSGIERTARNALIDLGHLLRLSGQGGAEALGVAALPDLVEEVREQVPELDLHVDLPVVSASLSTSIYRIVQEGLTNVVRHSAAKQARVTVARDDGNVVVRVEDPGPARSRVRSTGRGLVGLEERVHLLGGEVEAGPCGDGWRLRATLPWSAP